MRHPHHYDPSQPRVPKGHSTGGQWTDGNHGQATILEEGDLTNGGCGKDTLVQLAFADPRSFVVRKGLEALVAASTALFAELSLRNTRDQHATITFRISEYRDTGQTKVELESIQLQSADEVGKTCKEFKMVQDLTNKAAADIRDEQLRLSPSAYGTEVHQRVKKEIDAKNRKDFLAELSISKTRAAAKALEVEDMEVPHGLKGSIRIDAFENLGNGTICVYDIKTGQRVFEKPRMDEIAATIFENFGPAKHIIMIEIRPWRWGIRASPAQVEGRT